MVVICSNDLRFFQVLMAWKQTAFFILFLT